MAAALSFGPDPSFDLDSVDWPAGVVDNVVISHRGRPDGLNYFTRSSDCDINQFTL